MSTHSSVPLLACAASLFAVIPIVAFRRRPNLREAITFIAGAFKLALVGSMLPYVLQGGTIHFTICEVLPNVPLAFRVDLFGMLFALVASSLWIATSLYAVGYMRGLNEHSQTRFYSFFAVAMSATLGVAFSANLLTMYVFYELLSLSTYPLVTHHQDREARTGGRTYLTYLLGTSVGFALPAMLFCYAKTGGAMDFAATGSLAGLISPGAALALLLLFVFGFSKAGLMPFHSWLPGAMVAPTPVSALLHAVAVVKVGVFCVFRVFTGVFGVNYLSTLGIATVISVVAAITIVVSSMVALSQDSLKRRLAFSTIGQLAYIILGISLLTPKGLTGAQLHIAAHAFGKITLFFCAGAIFQAAGLKYVSQMRGLGRRMPVTMSAFAIGSLSVIGLPPAVGLLSKILLLQGTVDIQAYALTGALLLSTLLNASYFAPVVFDAFFRRLDDDDASNGEIREAHPCCVIALSVTALISIGLFFFPDPFYALASTHTELLFQSPLPQ